MKKNIEQQSHSGEIWQRIAQIRLQFCNGNNTLFATQIGKKPSYTSQLCNGSKAAGKTILEEILSFFPEVSRAWLYFGEGEMLVENSGSIGIVAGGGSISNSGTIAGTMNSSSPDLDALIHTLSQLSETIHTQSDTLNQQSTQISRLIDLLASKE